ncbi:MAG: hypothetical protein R2828_06770 [Saprospiraceae bacterium]
MAIKIKIKIAAVSLGRRLYDLGTRMIHLAHTYGMNGSISHRGYRGSIPMGLEGAGLGRRLVVQ